mmetsp:Transcript_12373/g.13700  ORF Transcript_12373/g.13700 Transcript_12373/m.13700 type:complete len:120 (+) Transcript_12373:1493-1852(+)
MHELLVKHGRNVNFLTVYIVEAHASDEWPVGDPLKITQPRTTIERCGVARSFVKEYQYQLPMLVDTIENSFEQAYAAWPIRFYVIEDGTVTFVAQPDEMNTYDSIPARLDKVLSAKFSL